MTSRTARVAFTAVASAAFLVGTLLVVRAQTAPGGRGVHALAQAPGGGHGTPAAWRFRWPKGDPVKGRQVFVKLECYSCHEVAGETFPVPSQAGRIGPELAAMGPLHESEYFAEAILNPNAVIQPGKSYEASDGTSKMPSYNDAVTVQEVVDLVAYLMALKPPATGAAPAGQDGHGGHTTP